MLPGEGSWAKWKREVWGTSIWIYLAKVAVLSLYTPCRLYLYPSSQPLMRARATLRLRSIHALSSTPVPVAHKLCAFLAEADRKYYTRQVSQNLGIFNAVVIPGVAKRSLAMHFHRLDRGTRSAQAPAIMQATVESAVPHVASCVISPPGGGALCSMCAAPLPR